MLRPRLIPLVLAVGIGCAIHGGAWSQSLRELYDAARVYDAAYLAAKSQAEAVTFKAAQADALNLPTVGLNLGATQFEANGPSAFVGSGGAAVVVPGSNDTKGTTNVQTSISASLPLYNPANSATIRQAQHTLEVSTADLETAEQDLIVRVAQAYFEVLAAQDSLSTAQTSKRAISEQLASAKRNFEVGTATITDTREAQARFDLAGAQELAAENDLHTRLIALEVLVGRSNVKPLPLARPVVIPALMPADVNAWVRSADSHPTIRRARLALDIARLDTERARAANGPTVDLTGQLLSSRVSGTGTTAPGSTQSANLGVILKMPLYSGGSLQSRVQETLALEERTRNDLDAAQRGVAQATRVSYFGRQSLQAQVKALEAAESSSQLALEATQLGYKVGVRVNLDVLNAQTQLFTTRRDLDRARYDVILNGLKLRQASGQLSPNDVIAADRLFRK